MATPTASSVELSVDCHCACLAHALATENEEVMGLLVGDTIMNPDGTSTVRVAAAHILTRTDKREDRCEISEIQLANASAEAERLSLERGQKIRIVGWYHSHPHITVLPSHVDVRTQGSWQSMDSSFVGLIYSVFNEESDRTLRFQLTAFQAAEVANPVGRTQTFEQVEVPIKLMSEGFPQQMLGVKSPQLVVELMKVLFQEEETACQQALAKIDECCPGNPLVAIHHNAVHDKCLCKLLEYGCVPLQRLFSKTLDANQQRLEVLQDEEAVLRAKIAELKESTK